jgi:hypothetical protein
MVRTAIIQVNFPSTSLALPIRPGDQLSIILEKLAIASIAAKLVPLVVVCSYKLRCLLFVAATARESGGRREAMQCQFSFRFVHFDNHVPQGSSKGTATCGLRLPVTSGSPRSDSGAEWAAMRG